MKPKTALFHRRNDLKLVSVRKTNKKAENNGKNIPMFHF